MYLTLLKNGNRTSILAVGTIAKISATYNLIRQRLFGKWCFSYTSPSCQTLSKACVMSRNVAEQYLFFSKSLLIIFTMRWTCSIVAWFCLKLNWWSGMSLHFISIGFIHFSRSFEKVLIERVVNWWDGRMLLLQVAYQVWVLWYFVQFSTGPESNIV